MMRISTPQVYNNGTNGILANQYDMYRLQNQLSTGRKVVTPADDPVASAQALLAEQKKHVNLQFLDNQGNAGAQLRELESLMGSVGELLIQAKVRWVDAGNGGYSSNELKSIAQDVKGKLAELMGIGNNADSNGIYRFAGYQGGTQPFINNGTSIQYQGDSGERLLQVETSRFMPVNFSGRAFFEAVMNGNGAFVTGAAATNTGNGVIDNGSVVGAFDGNSHTIQFGTGTISIDSAPPIPYTGGSITVGGAQVGISGTPGIGDTFTIDPSTEESMFTTLQKFITALETGSPNSAQFQNDMYRIGASLDQGLQHAVDSRAIIGARMVELEDLTNLGQDLDVQYKTQISELVDLDYASAISELAKKELQLNAAQQSFVKVTGLSLFNYI